MDGSIRYAYIKVSGRRGYFSNSTDSGGGKTYSANQICEMVEILIDSIFVKFGDTFFVKSLEFQSVPTVPLLTDPFFYSYESDFLDSMTRSGHRKLAKSFNLCL